MESTDEVLHGVVRFDEAQFTKVREGTTEFTKIEIPGTAPGSGQPGVPAIPRWRALIAVPDGATPVLRLARPVMKRAETVHVYPYQPLQFEWSTEIDSPLYRRIEPPPSLYQGRPFTINADAYESREPFPASPCSPPQLIGKARDLSIASIECASGQYIPASDTLRLFESIELQIGFQGGSGFFLTKASLGPFEDDAVANAQALLNGAAVPSYVAPDYEPKSCKGEEMLILSHPNYLAAATELALWRNQHGVPANVFAVNDGPGPGPDTNTDIKAFIQWRLDHCQVRPRYVLLFGGAADIPTFHLTRLLYENTNPPTLIASDFPYATQVADPAAAIFTAFFGVGRIPVSTAQEALTVVHKIKAYESAPTANKKFYTTADIASYFECCNPAVQDGAEDGYAFIQNSETYRKIFLNEGFSVNRLYSTSTVFHQNNPNPAANYYGDPTPRFFANLSPLPAALLPPNNPWTTTNNDVIAAFNEGANFVLHLDHGWTGGWGAPSFGNSDVPSLANFNQMNLVFDMDCSSGDFDADSFVYHMLRQEGGGAVGMTGFTAMSNSAYAPTLTKGILDAIWSDVDPSWGIHSYHKLGQIFDFAKMYMSAHAIGGDPTSTDYKNTLNHVRLWHLFGDPAMYVWTEVPTQLPQNMQVKVNPNAIQIAYDIPGATLTVFQTDPEGGTVPIGRGVISRGTTTIDFVNVPNPRVPLQIVATKPNALPASVSYVLPLK